VELGTSGYQLTNEVRDLGRALLQVDDWAKRWGRRQGR